MEQVVRIEDGNWLWNFSQKTRSAEAMGDLYVDGGIIFIWISEVLSVGE
jgi:hypothetical protein